MSPPSPDPDDRDGELLRTVTARAIRRLDLLGILSLAAAALLAVGAGALLGFLISAATEVAFRPAWMAASVLFFVVPAALTWWTDRRGARRAGGTTGRSPGSREPRQSNDRPT